MPVGSHKDAFKAHQVVKRLAADNPHPVLARLAADILLDFVKNQRQIRAESPPPVLPADSTPYVADQLDRALQGVESLCGKCEESHDDGCFVNQTRRALIAARTGIDLGPRFDGKKLLADLIAEADRLARVPSRDEPAAAGPGGVPPSSPAEDDWRRRYEDLREQEIFRSTLIDEAVETIRSVTRGDFAAEMPVHDDEQLAKVATAFNLMLRAVHETMRNLDRLVAARSGELRTIMDTVPVGLLTLNEALRIQPEYSKACEAILGLGELRGRDFLDTLGLTRRRGQDRIDLASFLDFAAQGRLDERDVAFLNPFPELALPGPDGARPTWVRLQYKRIDRGSEPAYLLVVLEDITEAKALQERAEQSERRNNQLVAVAEDPDLFCDFLREARAILAGADADLAALPTSPNPMPLIHGIFRGVHTIKGSGGAVGLGQVSCLAGALEERLSQLRAADSVAAEALAETRAALDDIRAAVEEAVRETEKLLGVSLDGAKGAALRIDSHEIRRHMDEIGALPLAAGHRAAILERLAELRRIDLKKGLARSLRIVPGLIQRLDKDVEFRVEDGGLRLDCDVAHELNGPLVHLLRNAFDHGIEGPEERELLGKRPRGLVRLTAEAREPGFAVVLADDGKGLDPEALRTSAVKKGLLTPEEAAVLSDPEAQALIFRPGFSTAAVVSDVSGRGVGMDAVVAAVRGALGGALTLESTPGQGTRITLVVPQR